MYLTQKAKALGEAEAAAAAMAEASPGPGMETLAGAEGTATDPDTSPVGTWVYQQGQLSYEIRDVSGHSTDAKLQAQSACAKVGGLTSLPISSHIEIY